MKRSISGDSNKSVKVGQFDLYQNPSTIINKKSRIGDETSEISKMV